MDIMNTLLWVLQFVVGAMLMLGHQRFIAQIDLGGLPFAKIAQTIECWRLK